MHSRRSLRLSRSTNIPLFTSAQRVRGKLPDEDMRLVFQRPINKLARKRRKHRWKFGCGASYADQDRSRMQAIKWQSCIYKWAGRFFGGEFD